MLVTYTRKRSDLFQDKVQGITYVVLLLIFELEEGRVGEMKTK